MRYVIEYLGNSKLYKVTKHILLSNKVICHYYQGNCTKENDFGFRAGRPCILIKLNKIFGWEPIPYQEKDLPEHFPPDLERKIKKNKEEGNANLVRNSSQPLLTTEFNTLFPE